MKGPDFTPVKSSMAVVLILILKSIVMLSNFQIVKNAGNSSWLTLYSCLLGICFFTTSPLVTQLSLDDQLIFWLFVLLKLDYGYNVS